MRKDLPVVPPAAARISGVRWCGVLCVFSDDSVWPAAMRFLLWARAACSERRARERGENGTVGKKGVSRGLFIGSAGPPTSRIYCARPVTSPRFNAHVCAVCGVTVASCNGHSVGYGM